MMISLRWPIQMSAGFLFTVAGVTQPSQTGTTVAANPTYQYKVGVLPFVDTTGNLDDKRTAIARLLQSELTHNSNLEVRFIKPADDAGSDIDSEQAVKLARDHENDVVILATILSAQVEESDHSASGPSIFGQTLGGSSHSAKASVELQADLYNSATGKKLDSIRVTGEEKVNKISGSADTSLGGMGSDGQVPDSPLGKAMQKAVHSVALRVIGDESRMIRFQPPTDAPSAEPKPNQ
jgi:Curli production assembly/transport component CsgG